MISRIARLSLATLISVAIGVSPLTVLAADPAPAAAPAAAPTPAPTAVPADKAAEQKAKKKAKKEKSGTKMKKTK